MSGFGWLIDLINNIIKHKQNVQTVSVQKGNTSQVFTLQIDASSHVIQQYIISNKGNTTVSLIITIIDANSSILIAPLNLQLSPGQSYADRNIELPGNNKLNLAVTGGSVDYYFYYT